MPEVDGLTLANRLVSDQDLNTTPKLVLITAATRLFDDEPEELTRHIDAVLTKPLNPSLLFDTLINVLSGRPMQPGKTRVDVYDESTLAPIKGAKLLLVEDNELNQQVAIDLLELGAFHIDVAENGLEAIAMVEKTHYDCVLMDIHMPEMDGYTATRFIRNELKFESLPILAMTANVLEADIREAFESGMNAHIGKPIEPAKLFDALLKWIPAGTRLPHIAQSKTATNEFTLPVKLTGVDMGKALLHVNGRRDLLADLLIDFSRDFSDVPTRIQALVAEADMEEGHRLAHSTKGILGTIGATSLQTQAQLIEQSFKNGDFVSIVAQLPDFGPAYATLISEIHTWYRTHEENQQKSASEVPGSEIDIASSIARLRGHLENFSPAAKDEALVLAQALPTESETTGLLLDSLANFDFDAAMQHLETLQDRIMTGNFTNE
jgi:CheY-like chemotaxis protein